MIGYLSPEGHFYKCESYGHLSKAREICVSLFNKKFSHIVRCENYLLENGFVVFQVRNVYKNDKRNALTNAQIVFLYESYKYLNSMQQVAISLMLLEED